MEEGSEGNTGLKTAASRHEYNATIPHFMSCSYFVLFVFC